MKYRVTTEVSGTPRSGYHWTLFDKDGGKLAASETVDDGLPFADINNAFRRAAYHAAKITETARDLHRVAV